MKKKKGAYFAFILILALIIMLACMLFASAVITKSVKIPEQFALDSGESSSGFPSVSIKMKDSFSLGEDISYEYTFKGTGEAGEEIQYVASYSCPSAPLEQPEWKKMILSGRDAREKKQVLSVTEDLEPQTCEAFVFVKKGAEEKIYTKSFEIKKDKAFKFEGKINKKIFLTGEKVQLRYKSNYEEVDVSAAISYPDGKRKRIPVPYSFVARQDGKYSVEISATRISDSGIKTKKKSRIEFSVLSQNIEAAEVPAEIKGPRLVLQQTANQFQAEPNEFSASEYGYFYMNYTKPANAVSAIWTVKHGTFEPYNISIPLECFNASSQKLILRISSNANNGLGQSVSQPACWNGSEWIGVGSAALGSFVWSNILLTQYCNPVQEGEHAIDDNWSTFSGRLINACIVPATGSVSDVGRITDDINIPDVEGYGEDQKAYFVYEEEIIWNLSSAKGDLGKDISKYSTEEVFIVSDAAWENVLQLTPAVVWREKNSTVLSACHKGYGTEKDICIYPSLIFHEDSGSFDADSTIHFLQQYNVTNVTLVGDTPQEFDNLLTASPEQGAGLSSEQIKRITQDNILNYWGDYPEVVYCEDDYEKGLIAASYASLKNIPLIIAGTSLDSDGNFAGKNITCVGSVSRNCNKSYTIEQLKQEYKTETNSTRLLMVNPDDLSISLNSYFYPDKSSGYIYNLYTKNSLAAPYLASAKKEILISQNETGGGGNEDMSNSTWVQVLAIRDFAVNESRKFGLNASNFNNSYLTIIASPNAIQSRYKYPNLGGSVNHRALDPTVYADYDNDSYPELAVGRLMGISVSDVSSQIASSLFYTDIRRDNINMKFFGANVSGTYTAIYRANNWSAKFRNASYNAINKTNYTNGGYFDPNDYYQQLLISYNGHGNSLGWSGIYYYNIPYLNSTMVFTDSCLNCAGYATTTFCNNMIRMGAVTHTGTVSISWGGDNMVNNTLSNMFSYTTYIKGKDTFYNYTNMTVGMAYKLNYNNDTGRWMNMLQGDPTFHPSPQHYVYGHL